jgi:hypothetical protein
MAKVIHYGSRGNQSRPRSLLEGRTIERLKEMAAYLGYGYLRVRISKKELIELLTTDKLIPAEVEEAPDSDTDIGNAQEPVVDPIDAEAGGEAE